MIEDLGFFSESLPTETTTKILPGCTEAIYLGKADIQVGSISETERRL